MAIISQLFSPQDLKVLIEEAPGQLNALAATITANIPTSPTNRLTTFTSDMLQLPQNVSPDLSARVTQALRNRAWDVFKQLTSSTASNPTNANLDLSQKIFPQLFIPGALNELNTEQQIILEWAINCEVATLNLYLDLYAFLQPIKQAADQKFRDLTGFSPGDTDVRYSPFHPLNPFHDIFYPASNP
jgi:hypothetical protein